jgi:gliding motility-associated-like protein
MNEDASHRDFPKYIITAVLFLLINTFAFAQLPTPQLVSLSVEANGSITASWGFQSSGTFDGFRLFYRIASPGTPFNSIDFAASATSGPIPVLDAQTAEYEAFITTYTNSGASSSNSNSLRTMILTVSKIGTGTARLDWNRMIQGTNQFYKIFRSDDNVTYTQVGTSTTNSFQYQVEEACDLLIYFRVEFETGIYRGTSSVGSERFIDDNQPLDPTFTHITINEQGYAVLNWSHSLSTDVVGYQIEVKTGFQYDSLTTVPYTNTYLDNITTSAFYKNPCEEVVTYVIKAIDLCGNTSAQNVYSPTSIHNTILLNVDAEINCDRKATLKWNKYNNIQPALAEYRIMRSQNMGTSIQVGTISSTNAFNYEFTDEEILTPGDLYTYHVMAVSTDQSISSESCRVNVIPDPDLVNAFDLDNVTVFNNEYINLLANGEPPALIHEVEVFRSAANAADMQSIMKSGWSSANVTLPETSALVNEAAYYYQIVALDACGFEMAASTIFRSIYLGLFDMGNGSVRLNWNEFEGWGNSLVGYNVYRTLNGSPAPGFPEFVFPGTLVYNDPSPDPDAGKVTYYIEALRNDDVVSRSNEVHLPGEAEVLMPNAFRPGGLNSVFRPKTRNIVTQNYRFVIYNRWGQIVFETNDYDEGWDGTVSGSAAPSAVYAYILTYSDYEGISYSKRGSVMLMR